MEKERECFAVRAGGFEAGVDSLDPLLGEPGKELLKAWGSIGEEFMSQFIFEVDEANIELEFGDVNAEHWLCQDNELLRSHEVAARVKLADASSALSERLRILSDLVRGKGSHRELF
jgi:hypothetical protein